MFDLVNRIKENPLIKKSLKVLLIRVLGVVLFFGLSLFITNYYSASNVGAYDFSKSILSLFGTFCLLGMNESIIYYSGYLKGKKIIGSLFVIHKKMVLILLSISLLILLVYNLWSFSLVDKFFDTPDINVLILKTFSILFFYGITILNIDTLRGLNMIELSEYLRNIFRFIFFLIAVVLFHFFQIKVEIVDVFLLNFIFLALITSLILLSVKSQFKRVTRIKNISFKKIFLRSYPMSVSLVSLLLMQSVDVIILKKYNDYDVIAHYSIAIKITTAISLVLSSVNAVYAPKIAEMFSLRKFEELKIQLKASTRLIFILTIPIIIFLFLFSNFILKLFGKEYMNASTTLLVLLVGQSINAFCGSVGMYFNMTGKQNVYQIILVLAFVINLILNLILIPKYNMIGAALATSFSLILWNILGAIYLFKKDKVKTFLN
ncbi:MATE family efflux transporter [Winogradskyella ursingii]|uniref:MATE family efflux transporter n=1 Tax=Winogradskyella ursingii TaxID=2686079 RepID=UPI0015CC78DA|nr:MATE family efflux transporter [Winogradskyella ursingii]